VATHKKVLELEKVKTDSNHVPTSVDAYTVGSLKESFDDRDLATDLQLALNKNRLASMGSNFCDYTKLGFKDAAALEKAHKTVDLKYLRQTNRMARRAQREGPAPVGTCSQVRKLLARAKARRQQAQEDDEERMQLLQKRLASGSKGTMNLNVFTSKRTTQNPSSSHQRGA